MSRTTFGVVLFASLIAFAAVANPSRADVRVTAAWANPTPPGVTVGAAFMTLVANSGDKLVSASSPVAERVELHSMTTEGGMMRMRPLPNLPLPAGKAVELSPTGSHFMLIGLKQPLTPNSKFTLQLRFQKAGERSVSVEVRALPQ